MVRPQINQALRVTLSLVTLKNSRGVASEITDFCAILYICFNCNTLERLEIYVLTLQIKCLATAECNGSLCNIESMASNLERC